MPLYLGIKMEFNLYKKNLENTFREYDFKRVKKELEKYDRHLNDIINYHNDRPVRFSYEKLDNSANPKKSALAGAPQTKGHVRIRILNADSADVRPILADDYITEIREYDDTDPKKRGSEIGIVARDQDKQTLTLERLPRSEQLQFTHNTTTLRKQRRAIQTLMYSPSPEHAVLLKLFHDRSTVDLDPVEKQSVDEWFVLTEDRDGADQQKEFVQKAINTPDFAFLEGPPGSGKTTALCELVHQLARRRKRVLFCASTHVAVDNLLEKIAAKYTKRPADSNIIPLRIGDSPKISDNIRGYLYDQFPNTMREKIQNHLSGVRSANRSQRALGAVLNVDDAIQCIARDCANLICGTTMGILKYPDLKDNVMFDYMILDEASKTTFQEFLVPAIHAKRWIIVGDTKQLAPYTDQKDIALHVDACLDEPQRTVYCDVFLSDKGDAVMAVADDSLKNEYRKRCDEVGAHMQDADAGGAKDANLLVGSAASLARTNAGALKKMLGKPHVIRGYGEILKHLEKTKEKNSELRRLWKELSPKNSDDDSRTWSAQIAWRLITLASDIALAGAGGDGQTKKPQDKIQRDIELLLPCDEDLRRAADANMADAKAVALPSILQLLQHGYGRRDDETVMTKGMPKKDFEPRHVLLQWQHRMHPDIAEFSRNNVYEQKALNTPKNVKTERYWEYDRYEHRFVWLDIKEHSATTSNKTEADLIIQEITKFYNWACSNPRPSGVPWEVAVLSFYTKQACLLEQSLRNLTSSPERHTFTMLNKGVPVLTIELRTLDSFQGHEADVVFLSMSNQHHTYFLENSNRLNVAITRARYQNVIVGNQKAMKRSDSLLGQLATHLEAGGRQ